MSIEQSKKLFMGVITIGFLLSVFTFSFSFFYMQSKGTKGVDTEAAKLGLALNVKRITNDKTIGLLPLSDNELQAAVTGTDNGSCVDSIKKGRCQIYEVKLTNTGNVTSTIMGTVDLQPNEKSEFKNLKWVEIRNENDATPFGSIHSSKEKNWKNDYVMGANASSTFYILVWISETGQRQNDEDKGSFTGNVTFNSTAGAGTSAAFVG